MEKIIQISESKEGLLVLTEDGKLYERKYKAITYEGDKYTSKIKKEGYYYWEELITNPNQKH